MMLDNSHLQQVAQLELNCITSLLEDIDANGGDQSKILEKLSTLETFCRSKSTEWGRLNEADHSGSIDDQLLNVLNRLRERATICFNCDINIAWEQIDKISSTIAALIDCLSSNIDRSTVANLGIDIWRCISLSFNGPMDRSSSGIASRCRIIELFLENKTFLDGICSTEQDARNRLIDGICTLLNCICTSQIEESTALSARLCSATIDWLNSSTANAENKFVMRRLMQILYDAIDRTNNDMEAACVGMYCLIDSKSKSEPRTSSAFSYDLDAETATVVIRSCRRFLRSDSGFMRKCGHAILSKLIQIRPDLDRSADGVWKDFLVFSEALELKQLHIVRPAFAKLDNLIRHCQQYQFSLDEEWLLVAFERAFRHFSPVMVTVAVHKYFDIDPSTIPRLVGNENCQFLFDKALPTLIRNDVFYRIVDEFKIEHFLSIFELFLRRALKLSSAELFWKNWLQLLHNTTLSPIPLFYVNRVFSRISHDGCRVFDATSLEQFRNVFFKMRSATPPLLRAAIQEETAKTLFNLYRWNMESAFKLFMTVCPVVPALTIEGCLSKLSLGEFIPTNNDGRGDDIVPIYMANAVKQIRDISESYLLTSQTGFAANEQWPSASITGIVCLSHVLGNDCLSVCFAERFLTQPVSSDDTIVETSCLTMCLVACPKHAASIDKIDSRWLEKMFDFIIAQIEREDCDGKRVKMFEKFIDAMTLVLKNSEETRTPSLAQYERYSEQLQKLYTLYRANGSARSSYILLLYTSILRQLFISRNQPQNHNAHEFVADLFSYRDELLQKNTFQNKTEFVEFSSQCIALKWHCLLCLIEHSSSNDRFDWKIIAARSQDDLELINHWKGICALFSCLKYSIAQLPDDSSDLITSIVRQISVVTEENRKSEHFLPVAKAYCEVVFQWNTLQNRHAGVISELNKSVNILLAEGENLALSQILAETVYKTLIKLPQEKYELLTNIWLDILLKLCLFGYASGRDRKMLHDTAEMILNDDYGYHCKSFIDSDHLAFQSARLYGVAAVHHLCQKTFPLKLLNNFLDILCDEISKIAGTKNSAGYFMSSSTHRLLNRAAQLLLILEPTLTVAMAKDLQKFILNILLKKSHQTSVRLLFQWILIRLMVRYEEGLLDEWWDVETYIHQQRLVALCSWMEVLTHVGLTFPDSKRQQFALKCVKRFMPWCTTQNFTVRYCAQACLRKIFSTLDRIKSNDIVWVTTMDMLQQTLKFDTEQRNGARMVEKTLKDFYFSTFQPLVDYSFETIFHTLPRLCGLSWDELISPSLWNRFFGAHQSVTELLPIFNKSNDLAKAISITSNENSNKDGAAEEVEGSGALQVKANQNADATVDLTTILLSGKARRSADDGLIVIASLIDRPSNLGGLCRTSEIFAAAQLVLPSLNVLTETEFQALSVTSERWVKLQEVKPSDLLNYLREIRLNDGYTIVAVEQTTKSKRLGKFTFPAKTALLLGNEREGIPFELLQYVDTCVEIPQFGLIRSLNVHVAGALFVWEYCKQWRFAELPE